MVSACGVAGVYHQQANSFGYSWNRLVSLSIVEKQKAAGARRTRGRG